MKFIEFVNHWNVSGYNYDFEICALIFLIFFMIKYFVKRRFPTAISKFFSFTIICAVVDIVIDILASIFVDHIYDVPIWIQHLLNGSFYIFQVAFPAMMFVYILLLLGPKVYKNKQNYLWLIPFGIFALLDLTNPLTNWIFYFGENELGQLSYLHGKLFLSYYITCGFYLLLVLIYTIIHRQSLSLKQIAAIIYALVFIIVGVTIQMIFPTFLLTGIAITCVIVLMEDNIANPDDMIDRISGVFNFSALMTYFERVINLENKNHYITIEIESISPVNDTFGMVVGNNIYTQIGSFLNQLSEDIWAFRIFSSKFLLAFASEETAYESLKKIQERFEEPWIVGKSEFALTCKLVIFPDGGEIKTCEQLLSYASIFETQITKETINETIYIDKSHFLKIQREMEIENLLFEHIDDNFSGFSLKYQPVYDTTTKKFCHAEALIRFKCEEMGMISPGEFIPIAEKAGLATQIDEWVLKQVCAFMNRHPEIESMDINVSGAEFFTNPANKFLHIIEESGVDIHRLCFEITETASIKYPHHTQKFMNTLITAGATFAIDDFGTGYSNISQLLNQPFDLIKLDRTLLNDNPKIKRFLKSVTDLFAELHYPVLIEGVETKEELDYILSLGIDYVQGYYFSKPLDEDDFIEFIKTKNQD